MPVRRGVSIEHRFRGHDHPRCAKSALEGGVVHKGLLDGVELSGLFVGQAFDGGNLAAMALHGQSHARQYRGAVHDDRAGTAGTLITPDLGPGQIESFPEGMRQGM